MILIIFKKIINLFSFIENKLIKRTKLSQIENPQIQAECDIRIEDTNTINVKYLNSSQALERSRAYRQGAIYSNVLLPKGLDEKYKDPETLFNSNLNSSPEDFDLDDKIDRLNEKLERLASQTGHTSDHIYDTIDDEDEIIKGTLNTPLYLWEYDYMQHFMCNNSLEHGGIPLCFSPSQEEIIKLTDAIYCSQQKCWFWPFKKNANLNEIFSFLPKAHQLEDNVLLPNLVPEPLWGENLRRYLSKKEWDFLRKHTYAQSGYRCSICGGKGEKWPVECDEVWDYRPLDDESGIAVLIALRALCPRCHRVNHLGKANIDGKYDETVRHMAYINRWTLNHAYRIAQEAFDLFNERSEKAWTLGYDNELQWDASVEKILKTLC